MNNQNRTHWKNYTSNILEKLLIADLDSHTPLQNACQLEELEKIIADYKIAVDKIR